MSFTYYKIIKCDWCNVESSLVPDSGMRLFYTNADPTEPPDGWVKHTVDHRTKCPTCGRYDEYIGTEIKPGVEVFHFCCEDHKQRWIKNGGVA